MTTILGVFSEPQLILEAPVGPKTGQKLILTYHGFWDNEVLGVEIIIFVGTELI